MKKLAIRRHRKSGKGLQAVTGVLAAVAASLFVWVYPDLRRYMRIRNM